MTDRIGTAIYIRYRNCSREIRLMENKPNAMWFQTPDREIYICTDVPGRPPPKPPFDWDEIIYPSPIWPHKASPRGSIGIYMLNYTSYIDAKRDTSPNFRSAGRLNPVDQTIMSDSGGFQLMSGSHDFLNPLDIIEWYNDNVDIGIALDVPLGPVTWDGAGSQQAKTQAYVLNEMIKRKAPHVEMMNVVHGGTIAERKEYHDIVDRDDVNKLAIGGQYFSTPSQATYDQLHIILQYRPYEHYHALGVSHAKNLYPMMRTAAKKLVPYITSDGTTYSTSAYTKKYLSWPTVDSTLRYKSIGYKKNFPSHSRWLTCSCPVCSSIKYSDILSEFDSGLMTSLLSLHNMYTTVNYTRTMYDIIEQSTFADLKSLIKYQYPARLYKWQNEMVAAIGLVDHIAENGIDKADQYGSVQVFLGTKKGKDAKEEVEAFEMPSLEGLVTNSGENRINPVRYDDAGNLEYFEVLDKKDPTRVRIETIFEWLMEDVKVWEEHLISKPKDRPSLDDFINKDEDQQSNDVKDKETKVKSKQKKLKRNTKRLNSGALGTAKPGKTTKKITARPVRKKEGTYDSIRVRDYTLGNKKKDKNEPKEKIEKSGLTKSKTKVNIG